MTPNNLSLLELEPPLSPHCLFWTFSSSQADTLHVISGPHCTILLPYFSHRSIRLQVLQQWDSLHRNTSICDTGSSLKQVEQYYSGHH